MGGRKKNARRLNAWLAFLDESGFGQRPPVRATWAPRGQTPILHEPLSNWQTLSGIGLVLVCPRTRRVRWLLRLHRGAIRSRHIVRFLDALKAHRRRRVLLVWDGLPAHRSRLVQIALHRHRAWLSVERLPAYAPELNPVEPFWNHLDTTTLANTRQPTLALLRSRLHRARERVDRAPALTWGFLRYTGLF